MAVRRISIILVITAAAATTAAILFSRSLQSSQHLRDDGKFIKTYVELAVARQICGNNPDSLTILFDDIFKSNRADSAWMERYIKGIGKNPGRYEKIWQSIVDALDSLKNESDSL